MNKGIVFIALVIMNSVALEACSFLHRYGANSYITNIPLFFKRQDPEAPQSKGDTFYETRETIIVEDKVEISGEIENKETIKSSVKKPSTQSRLKNMVKKGIFNPEYLELSLK